MTVPLHMRFRWRNRYQYNRTDSTAVLTVAYTKRSSAIRRQRDYAGFVGTELIAVSGYGESVVICFYPKGTRVG